MATRSLRAGDVVLCERPFAYVIHRDRLQDCCANCFRKGAQSRCGKCKTVMYCDQSCQRRDWIHGHKLECQKLNEREFEHLSNVVIADLTLLGRTLIAGDSEGDAVRPLTTAVCAVPPAVGVMPLNASFADVQAMQSHFDASAQLTDRRVTDALVADLARKLFKLSFKTAVEPLSMLMKFAANNFGIHDDLLNTIGSGVYPFGALLNHRSVHG
jgi:SET and MYND domain-containing protein